MCIRRHLNPSPSKGGYMHIVTQSMQSQGGDFLSSGAGQAAIKYYSFLATSQTLFDAAVGMCDFGMARAIARQGQMDPKVRREGV